MSYIPMLAFWAIALFAVFNRKPLIVFVFFCSLAFGSTAVIPTQLTGGVSFLAAPFAGLLLFVWTIRQRAGLGQILFALTSPSRFLFLALFILFAILSGLFLPRLFADQISVVPVRGSGFPEPLAPSVQNLTQSFYLIIALCTSLGVYNVAKSNLALIFKALSWGGVTLVLTGLVDLATKGTGLLEPFRTATYALHTNTHIVGISRVVGLMPEAAVYGSTCVAVASMLYFLRPGFVLSGRQTLLCLLTVLMLLVMAILSTSSTAYLMLGLFAGMATVHWLFETMLSRGRLKQATTMMVVVGSGVLAATLLTFAIFMPHQLGFIHSVFDTLIFSKMSSDSFEGRSSWNISSWEAFKATGGLGVGLGGARSSSWPLAVLSNTGIVGSALLLVFLLMLLSSRGNPTSALSRNLVSGSKLAMVIVITGLSISATTPNISSLLASLFGILLAGSHFAYRPVTPSGGAMQSFTSSHRSPVSRSILSETSGSSR